MFNLIPLAISAATGIAGGFANKQGMDPKLRDLRDQLIAQQKSLFNDVDLSGYGANASENINRNAELQRQKLLETLAARGVSGDAVGFAEANLDRNRFSDITSMQNILPLLQRQLKMDAIQSGNNILAGAHNATPQNNFAGGLLGNLTQSLAYMYGQGAFNGTPKYTRLPLPPANAVSSLSGY